MASKDTSATLTRGKKKLTELEKAKRREEENAEIHRQALLRLRPRPIISQVKEEFGEEETEAGSSASRFRFDLVSIKQEVQSDEESNEAIDNTNNGQVAKALDKNFGQVSDQHDEGQHQSIGLMSIKGEVVSDDKSVGKIPNDNIGQTFSVQAENNGAGEVLTEPNDQDLQETASQKQEQVEGLDLDEDKGLKCNFCNAVFRRKKKLDKHIEMNHSISNAIFMAKNHTVNEAGADVGEQYRCQFCSSTFPRKKELNQHVDTNHSIRRAMYNAKMERQAKKSNDSAE